MRARLGWVVAALLLALTLTSAPDALDTSPPASAAQSTAAGEIREKRDLRPHDDVEIRHQVAERGTPGHLRLAALPPSPQTAAPVPVRGTAQAPPDSAPATVVDLSGRPRLGTRTPEALQIFRC